MQERDIDFNFKARYFKLGDISKETKQVWFVLHGYGQLAKYFLNKFKPLVAHNICVIAPEGLSRFYMEDIATRSQTGNNRVGATWMTRENRLMDIDNYIAYLNSVYQLEMKDHYNLPVTIVGFSQGAATASRWILSKSIAFSKLILWAGLFPDDMDFEKGKEVLKEKDVRLVYGRNDPFLTDARVIEMKSLAQKTGVTSTPIIFDGAHEMNEPTLLELIN
jgi:predicted esterase